MFESAVYYIHVQKYLFDDFCNFKNKLAECIT